MALATQTGGSTIRPASFNGIYGFKPTWGAVSREGQKFYSLLLDTLGWYGRSVEDLSLLADVLNLRDDESSSFKGVRGARIAVCRTDNWPYAGEGTKAALERAKDLLKKHGAVVEEVILPPSFAPVPEWHRVLLHTDGQAGFLPEYRVAKEQVHVSLTSYIDFPEFNHKQQLQAQDGIAALRPVFDEIATGYDAVLTASAVDEAPEGLEFTGDAVFCAMWTVGLVSFLLKVSGCQTRHIWALSFTLVRAAILYLVLCKAASLSVRSDTDNVLESSRHFMSLLSICRASRARQACLLACPSSRPASGTDTF